MALKDFPELHGLFNKLAEERAAILAQSEPLRLERERVCAELAPLEQRARELADNIRSIEMPRLAEIDRQMGALGRATGGYSLTHVEERR